MWAQVHWIRAAVANYARTNQDSGMPRKRAARAGHRRANVSLSCATVDSSTATEKCRDQISQYLGRGRPQARGHARTSTARGRGRKGPSLLCCGMSTRKDDTT